MRKNWFVTTYRDSSNEYFNYTLYQSTFDTLLEFIPDDEIIIFIYNY